MMRTQVFYFVGVFLFSFGAVAVQADQTSIDLTTWSAVQYEINNQPNANWTVAGDGLSVRQSINADPSIFIGDFDSVSQQIEGLWEIESSGDDDFVGFVFGYQNRHQYYLFDWKQKRQSYSNWGYGDIGMSIKVVNLPIGQEPTGRDLWNEGGSGSVTVLRHNTVGWEDPKEYLFRLNFTDEGQFRIIVRDADTNAVLEDWIVQDSTFTGGFFGFYNFSQAPIRYAGFTTTVVEDNRLFFRTPWDDEGLGVKSGSTQVVEWGDEGFITNVMLEYTANGSDWETIEASTVNDGAYEWTVPAVTSDMCQLRVSDVDAADVYAVSEMFTIFECTRTLVADLNDDCYVNLLDLAIMAGEWLECGYPFDSECD